METKNNNDAKENSPRVPSLIVSKFQNATQLGKRLKPKDYHGRKKPEVLREGAYLIPRKLWWTCEDCGVSVRGGDFFQSGHWRECPNMDFDSYRWCLEWEERVARGEPYLPLSNGTD